MLRATQPNFIFIHQMGPNRFHSWKPTNNNINKLIMKLKERSKINSYYGYYLQRHPDRELMYTHLGGPRGGRFYVRQRQSAKQYEHYTYSVNKTGVHYHTKFGRQWQTATNQYTELWTGQTAVTGPLSFFAYNHFNTFHNGDRDNTYKVLESWGLKTVSIDSRTAPRVADLMVHRHKLYVHNFPWIKDPITNHIHGDADWAWKQGDNFDYVATRGKDHAAFNHRVMPQIEAVLGDDAAAAAAAAVVAAKPAAEGKHAKKKA